MMMGESIVVRTKQARLISSHQRHWLLTPLLLLVFTCFTSIAYAQQGKTILVLDASGSMWQKIDEGYKISIARNVINELLVTLPAEQELGLITYGHRRKGDCGDIEMLVPPQAGTRDAIASAIKSLDPKGKTPLSAAVIQAADELRIEENAATVILVSDGRETCNLDPCAVGNELESRGIDFTAHVIGFDIGEENDRAQLRCLAENTGGTFLTASTASELTEALVKVSKPIEPFDFSAFAVDDNNNTITSGLSWSLSKKRSVDNTASNESVELLSAEQQRASAIQLDVDPGKYTVSVTREEDGATKTLGVELQSGGSNRYRLSLPALEYTASLSGPDSVIIGERFSVEWQGPALPGDYITLAKVGSAATSSVDRIGASNLNPAPLLAPSEANVYELRYVQAKPVKILATAKISVKEAPATIMASDTAPAATSIPIEWTGPDQTYDVIAVGIPGKQENITSQRTSDGTPLQLQMPPEPGEYELRYVQFEHSNVLATRPITIVESGASVSAAQSAAAGDRIPVSWSGPDETYDTIVIAEVGNTNSINETRTSDGSPLEVEMPPTPGNYELRYFSYTFGKVLASQPIVVEETTATLSAADEAGVGSSITVSWEGPDEVYDVIAVAKVGEKTTINETRTSNGSPLELQMPAEPGEYELRYVLYQGLTVLASRNITVNASEVMLDAPAQADLGTTITVSWEGPNAQYDVVAVAKVGEKTTINETRTSNGSPLELQMPAEPGEFELRYVLYQGLTVLASRPITVNRSAVTLNAPEQAGLGSTVNVEWEGPNAQYDVVAVTDIGGKKIINETRTSRGNPLELQMPAKPGNYELRYILYQGLTTLATQPIVVNEVNVSLNAPDQVSASELVSIEWVGPNAVYDEIDIVRPGEKNSLNGVRTSRGSPAELEMPSEPGNYELRYLLYQDNTVLATRPIVVVE